jgi:glycolate dehydrogenase iron-sulfur subunit
VDPEVAAASGILETCVHYGFCTDTCPTYVLTRDENDSPRGRIDLIRAMMERGGAPEAKTVHHLDRCLSCLSCMTTCAVRVDYAHLIDHARAHIERHYRRPWADRLMRAFLAQLLPRPRLFLWAMRAGRAVGKLAPMLPRRLRTMLELVPSAVRPKFLAPGVFRAEGQRLKRVALLAGCAQQALNGDVNAATIRALNRHGCEVVIAPGAGCCGSLALHMGRQDSAREAARANVIAWGSASREGGLDAIVVNASGCGTTVKDYGHLLARDVELAEPARRVAALARDVSEILRESGLGAPRAPVAYRIAYHDPCSVQHGQRVTREPRELLKAAGFAVLDIPERHFCCGSAGTYNLLQPEMADRLGRRKAEHIASLYPDILATGNIGCMIQLGRFLKLPILHTVELLDWATGGPRPSALDGVVLRQPASVAAAAASSAAGSAGFW